MRSTTKHGNPLSSLDPAEARQESVSHRPFVDIVSKVVGPKASRGAGLVITYGVYQSPLGALIVAGKGQGLCWLGFPVDDAVDVPLSVMQEHWTQASFVRNDQVLEERVQDLIASWQGQGTSQKRLPVLLYGTAFQIKVWQVLLDIPIGQTLSYKDIAERLGKPSAARAVGGAVGSNPLSLIVPCHRVIQSSGNINNYLWGNARKRELLSRESAFAG